MNLTDFKNCHVLVVGDLMIDEYLWGDVDRISPEAPVQVVSVNHEDFTLGGSGNVVNNLAALGARVSTAGVVGTGADGRLLLDRFRELNVDTEGIVQDPERPTTRKTRIIAGSQHVLRIDRETRQTISPRTLDTLTCYLETAVRSADVVLISDYGKGLVSRDLMRRLTDMARQHGTPTIADPKGLDFSKYRGVSLLTPNRKEAALASGVDIVDGEALHKAASRILDTAALERLLITCGKDGMVLFGRNGSPRTIRSEARQVFDVSGAGDTVLAVFGLAVAAGGSFEEAAALANTAAGIVVGKVGTATVSGDELNAALNPFSDGPSSKVVSIDALAGIMREYRKQGRRIVLTNGCFDLLHPGHVKLLSASRQQGDVLIVAIDDDPSVRRLKGEGRPIISARERVGIVSAFDSVDHVVVFASDDLHRLIEIIRPDVLTKGSNYATDDVIGRKRVETLGGRVVRIPITDSASSTRIIEAIKGNTG